MLQTLEQPAPAVDAKAQQVIQPVDITPLTLQEPSPVSTSSVEAFAQPTVVDTTTTIIEPKVSITPKKRSFAMPD